MSKGSNSSTSGTKPKVNKSLLLKKTANLRILSSDCIKLFHRHLSTSTALSIVFMYNDSTSLSISPRNPKEHRILKLPAVYQFIFLVTDVDEKRIEN
jgi:hypothetical protein